AYFELAAGRHTVRVHAEAANPEIGQEPAFFLYEYSPEQKSWYHTFAFHCGGGDVCTIGDMEKWLGEAQLSGTRGIHDPCGSTRIEGLRWQAERSVGTKLAALELDFVLEVYKFKPRFPHGAKSCKGPSAESR